MFRIFSTLNGKALINAAVATVLLIVLVYVGSRDLQNFDAALIAYLFGSIFALFGVVYRYSVWLQRPPTRLYWRRTWKFVFSKRFFPYLGFVISQFFKNILFQRFIYPRGKTRWWGHFLLATGCMLAFMVTFPLTFGWIHFTLAPGTLDTYEAHVFGFKVAAFELGGLVAFNAFHILNWCSLFVIIGAIMMMRRRLTNGGLIATQSFQDDWLPLVLLLAIDRKSVV